MNSNIHLTSSCSQAILLGLSLMPFPLKKKKKLKAPVVLVLLVHHPPTCQRDRRSAGCVVSRHLRSAEQVPSELESTQDAKGPSEQTVCRQENPIREWLSPILILFCCVSVPPPRIKGTQAFPLTDPVTFFLPENHQLGVF